MTVEGPDGAVEVPLDDLDDQTLYRLGQDGSRAAMAAWWRRKGIDALKPGPEQQ